MSAVVRRARIVLPALVVALGVTAGALVFSPSSALAGQAGTQPAASSGQPPADQQPATFEDQVVVTASRVEQQLVNAPATVSVVSSDTILNAPSANVGDLLRTVPGVNVTQVSARDVNISSRGATGTLATSQLALVDGRSIYLDFFGMVMWDFVPSNPQDIRQIEVIRGPASAVWGANAMNGVVNVITKSPRELAGAKGRNSLTIGVGTFDRNVTGRSQGAGSLFSVTGYHAQAVNDRWAYKVSAGYLAQNATPRPTGALPSGTPYPAFANTGTSQPKFDSRVDYEMPGGGRLTMSGGVAGTEGIIHTGIGPFDIHRGARLGYASARYEQGARHVALFTNLLDGDAANLLTVGPDRRPITLAFNTKTIDVEAGDARLFGGKHLLSFGGNFRHNSFDISLAPTGTDRTEGGGYVEAQVELLKQVRLVAGGRVDKFSSIDKAVFSPRTTLILKPSADQSIRLSVNRAFRAPSLINNHLDVTVVTPVVLPVVGLFAFPTLAVGDPQLKQETLTAYEIGYTATFAHRATVSAAVYWNHTDGAIAFTPVAAYSAAQPPPGWPLPAAFVPAGQLTSRYTYVNLGELRDKGIELGIDGELNRDLHLFANYSHQWKPEVDFPAPFSVNDVNWPAPNRFNVGFNASHGRALGNATVSYTGPAYWQDVLDARFAGTTKAYTLVNAGVGLKWWGDALVTSLKVTNLGNREVMQHIFGDVMKRQVMAEARLTF